MIEVRRNGQLIESDFPVVYLAGKIGHTDWRHEIFTDLRTVEAWPYGDVPGERPKLDYLGSAKPLIENGMEYGGPFFMSCDHGCAHGRSNHGLGVVDHGCIPGGGPPPRAVANWCRWWLAQSHVVFCWLNAPDAYGTVFELGFARALSTPIYLAYQRDDDDVWRDTWLLREMADGVGVGPTPTHAWQMFKPWWSTFRRT